MRILKPLGATKRFFDLSLSLTAIILLSPFILASWIVIRFSLGSPVFFHAERLGYQGSVFQMYKFRTMTDERDDKGVLLPDEIRLTETGKFLRRLSIDELPGLLNVLNGEMSLVGPRPFTSLYANRYSARQFKRHDVKPGITGWSQINGRNALTWEEKFEHDLWYIANWSLWLDIKIIFLTAVKVLSMKDVNHAQHATAPEFLGSSDNLPPTS